VYGINSIQGQLLSIWRKFLSAGDLYRHQAATHAWVTGGRDKKNTSFIFPRKNEVRFFLGKTESRKIDF